MKWAPRTMCKLTQNRAKARALLKAPQKTPSGARKGRANSPCGQGSIKKNWKLSNSVLSQLKKIYNSRIKHLSKWSWEKSYKWLINWTHKPSYSRNSSRNWKWELRTKLANLKQGFKKLKKLLILRKAMWKAEQHFTIKNYAKWTKKLTISVISYK